MLMAFAVIWMVALSYHDLRRRRLPNWLTIPGCCAITCAAVGGGHGRAAFVGAVALAGIYLMTHLLTPAAMGAGDVKLALGIGSLTGFFGAQAWVVAALGAPLLTVLIGTVARLGWSARTVPHGPSMCAAGIVAIALG